MAEPTDRTQTAEAGGTAADGARTAERQPQVQIDDSKATMTYANFFRVAGMPEEMVLDFGLNTQPFGVPTEPIAVSLRVVMNFYTAKRMMHALQLAVQRHETAFGVIETDIQRRLRPGAAAGGPPPTQAPAKP